MNCGLRGKVGGFAAICTLGVAHGGLHFDKVLRAEFDDKCGAQYRFHDDFDGECVLTCTETFFHSGSHFDGVQGNYFSKEEANT